MEPTCRMPSNCPSLPQIAECNQLPPIQSQEKNVHTTQSKANAVFSFEPKLGKDATSLHIDDTSKVGKILTDGMSALKEFESVESAQNASYINYIEQKELSKNEQNSTKRHIYNCYSYSEASKRSKRLKCSNKEISSNVSLKSSQPTDSTIISTLSSDSFAVLGPNDSHNLYKSGNDNEVRLGISDRTESHITGSVNTGNPLKNKRTSKRGIENKDVVLKNIKQEASVAEDGYYFVASNTQASVKELTSEQLGGNTVSRTIHAPRCVLVRPAEVPTEVQREKLLSMHSTDYDLQCPPLWHEGELLWARVTGHPFWPCMVSRCPFSNMYTRIKGDVKIIRSYHVQFFGNEVERGWVNEPSLIVFEGKLKFLEMAQIELSKNRKGKSSYNPFKINIPRRDNWNIAVEEAEGAMPLSIEERNVQYTFDYVFINDLKKEQKKLKQEVQEASKTHTDDSLNKPVSSATCKRAISEENNLSPGLAKSKKRKLDTASSHVTLLGIETTFSSYYAKHRRSLIEQHPDWTTASVFEHLRQQWETEKTPMFGTSRDSSSAANILLTHSEDGKGHKNSCPELVKLLCRKISSGLPQENSEERCSVPRKRVHRPNIMNLKLEHELDSAASPSAFADLETSKAKSTSLASTLSSRKTNQQSDSSTQGRRKSMKEKKPYELEIFKLNSTCKIEKDQICAICEKNGDIITCTGPCGQHFHITCIDAKIQPGVEQYMCQECTSDNHTCFACKKADIETIKCSVNSCGKYYHEDCIKKYRLSRIENKGFICPLHTCATCAVDSVKNPKAVKGRFFRCVRCPTAYHVGDFCIAAGSINLGGSHIVCSDHFEPNKSMSCHSRLNITWCFSCSKGGKLLCCESCPAAFHEECAEVDKTPDEAWFCVDCSEGKKPLYGNIVWIKVGNYRWWPGEICHPRHVPLNIQEKPHQVGEFPVRFFGSHDYYWMHKGRVFLFQEGDKGSKEGSSRGLFKVYMKGVNEATEAFTLWTAANTKKVEQEQERNEKKPAPYKYIKSNVPVGKVQIHKAELSEIPKCECQPDQEDACTSDCLNRLMMYECHPSTCPAGEKCHNQRFQKRQYTKCEPFKSEARGWGLRCLEDMKKGQFVLEYVGDVIDETECKRRIEQAHDDNITNFYMLTMDKNRTIDAGPRGNFSRFMNHSCCPNVETQKWTVNGDIRVGLFALCDIPKGSELTFNYNLECLGNEKKACACGSENCSGFLGVRPKTASANEKKAKEQKKKRRKKKLDKRKEYEDECFRCGEGGELVMCDQGSCPKVYHLKCLKLTKPPSGKWLCPWHHCDDCGKMATVRCLECPNSYCGAHTNTNIFKVDDAYVCSDHTDLLEGISQSVTNSSDDGTSGIKSEIKSDNDTASTNDKHSDVSRGADVDRSSNKMISASGVAISKLNCFDSTIEAEAVVSKNLILKVRQKDNKIIRSKGKNNCTNNLPPPASSSVVSFDSEVNMNMSGTSSNCAAQVKINGNSVSVQSDNPNAGIKRKVGRPRKITETTLCRTKARYKACLSPASTADCNSRASLVSKPVINHHIGSVTENLLSHKK